MSTLHVHVGLRRQVAAKWIAATAGTALAGLLCGCISAPIPDVSTEVDGAPAGIHGRTIGGNNPVTGSHIYLYAAGSAAGATGYGTSSVSLLLSSGSNVYVDSNGNYYVKTDSNGNFNITGDYNCTGTQYVYLLAVGGNPGNSTGNANNDITLMAALGSCSFLKTNGANIFVNINEVTTVAAVYALQQFMTSATAVGYSTASGTLPGNLTGLENAFGMANNLANFSNGTSPGAGQPVAGGTFAGLPSGLTVPSANIYSLANSIASCINSDPTNGDTLCSTLFGYAKSGGTTGTAPSDTVQAVLNIAKNPTANVSNIYMQGSSKPPFSGLSNAPNDWTMILAFAGESAVIHDSDQLAVDSAGNVWVGDNGATASPEVAKISPTGTVTGFGPSCSSGSIIYPYAVAIDGSDNAWFTDNGGGNGKGGLSEIVSSGASCTGRFTGGGLTSSTDPQGVAIDSSGNVWATVYSGGTASLDEFSSSGTYNSTTGIVDAGGISTTSEPYGIAFDSSGNIWVANRASCGTGATNGCVSELTSAGAAISGSTGYNGNEINGPENLAFDSSGNAWIADSGSNYVTELINSSGNYTSTTPNTYNATSQLSVPTFVAVDGLNNVWVANYATSTSTGCISEISNAGATLTGVCLGLNSVGQPHGLAIDGSGNLWIAGETNGVYMMVGAAAPVITPIRTATINSHLGVRP